MLVNAQPSKSVHRLGPHPSALPLFRQSSLSQCAVHPLNVVGREAEHAIIGIGLADREIWPQPLKLSDLRLGVIEPTEERQAYMPGRDG